MSRTKTRILWGAAVLIIVLTASVFTLRSLWFQGFLRTQLVNTLEETTGGKVAIGSFRFDATHLFVQVRGLVIHGTEQQDTPPLAAVSEIQLRFALSPTLPYFIKFTDLQIEKPHVNVYVNADGSTNIPAPRLKANTNASSPFATLVDLAVQRFQINNGAFAYAQTSLPLDFRGQNLHVLLQYNKQNPSYFGQLDVATSLALASGAPNIAVQVHLPITLTRAGIKTNNASLRTNHSQLAFNASLENSAAPKLTASAQLKLSIPEMRRFLNLANSVLAKPNTEFATANLQAAFDQATHILSVRTLQANFGATSLQAAGVANAATGESLEFKGNLALAELSTLFGLTQPSVSGNLLVAGHLRFPSVDTYSVQGSLNSTNLGFEQGKTHLTNVSLSSPFLVNSTQISLNKFQLAA